MRSKRSHGLGNTRDRGTYWQHRYHGKTLRAEKADYPTRKLAEAYFQTLHAGINKELQAKAEKKGRITMESLFLKFSDNQFRNNLASAENVRQKLNKYHIPRLGHMDADAFGLQDIDDYVEQRQEEKDPKKGTPVRNSTIVKEVSYILSALTFLRPQPRYLKWKGLDTSDGKRQGLVFEEEYTTILNALPGPYKPIMIFGWHCGIREGELLGMRRAWTKDWEKTRLIEVPGRHIGRRRANKNATPRLVPLYRPALRETVRWAVETANPECPFLFQRDGKPITKGAWDWQYLKAVTALKLKHVLFHDLRRTAVTRMMEAGLSEEEAMEISGHRDKSMLKYYHIRDLVKARSRILKSTDRVSKYMDELENPATDLARDLARDNVGQDTESKEPRKLN